MAAGTNLERTNWYQCSRFLIEGGRAILKDFFMKSYYPQTLDVFLNAKHNKDIIDSLCKKRILNQDQMNILFPNADIELFDITLLSCIILNCVIKGDYVKSDAVKEIRTLRNRVFGHVCTLSMTENEFKTNWNDINTTLLKTKKELCVNVSLNELADGIKNEELIDIEYMERMKFTIETFTRFDDVLSDIEHLRQEQVHNFKEVNKSLTCIQKTTAESNSSIRDIKDNVKKVKHGLEEVKDELQRVHNDPNEVEGWSSGLHNSLVRYYKRYLIQSPITATASSNIETDIDDIYAEPLLQLIDHKALCESSFEKNKMPINLKDIFGNGDHPCNIYVTGDAGMGKTSLTKYILSTWCNLHEKVETLNDFELALKHYDFLFYVSLRNATGQYYIEEMITSQLLKHIVASNKTLQGVELGELLKNIFCSSEKCLIILDGLDEWTAPKQSDVPSISNGVPGRNFSLQCTIITTTRPWKLEELRLKEREVDRQIQVNGVQDTSMLGKKLIYCLIKRTKKYKKFDDFADCLRRAGVAEMIETPIILKFLICLWFNGQDLGNSKTEIYTNVIELWFEIAEKKEGVKHLKEIADIGIDETISTPDIFKKKGKCVRYKTILSAVAKLAFETSMHKEGRQLIFDSTVDHGLSEEQMKICLKVGIFTQSTVPDITCERTSISFSHETFHEYFAALHTGWNSNSHDNIETSITGLTLSERGYFFIFLSGMWPLESVRLLERTMAKMFENCNTYNANELELICTQYLLRLCYIERMHQNKSLKVNLGSIHFNSSLYNIYMGLPLENSVSLRSKCKHFFSLISSMCQQNILQSRGDNFTFDFSKLCELKCLWLSNIEADSLKVSSTLSYLYLNEVKIGTEDGMMDLMSSIANAKSLRSISILLKGKQYDLEILIFLQSDIVAHLSKFRKISDKDIRKIYESAVTKTLTRKKQTKQSRKIEYVIDLSKHSQLKYIALADIYIKELRLSPVTEVVVLQNLFFLEPAKMFYLMKSLSSMHGLMELVLQTIGCAEHHNNEDCFLDLSNHTELRTVSLANISVSGLKVRQVHMSLRLINIKLANNGEIVSLMKSVTSAHGLKALIIENIYCAEHQNTDDCFLDLSNHNELRWVDLTRISVSGLKISPDTLALHLNGIKLANNGEIVSLMKSVSRSHGLEVLLLGNIDCSEHQNNEDCFIDLSNHTKLKIVSLTRLSVSGLKLRPDTMVLSLIDIKLANNGEIVSLMESVSSTHGLEVLVLQHIDCAEHHNNEDCFIDLSNHTELRFVSLTRISVSGLKARPVTKSLKLRDIKLANNGEIVSLMKSVSRTHGLEELVMKNIDCAEHQNNEDCFIDLSNHTELRIVELTRISVSGLKAMPVTKSLILTDIKLANNSEIVSLMKSVSRTHGLEELALENIDCSEHQNNEYCFLDLSNHTELTTVALANISFSGLKVRADTKSLSLIYIKLAKIGEIVSLLKSVSNMHRLEELVLQNIDCAEHLSNEDCFIDLSNHTKLRIVSLTRMSVSGLKLSPDTTVLSLIDIKLDNNGEILSLMESVSSTHGLEVLVLQNLDCVEHQNNEDCFLNLSNHSELKIVSLANIALSGLKARSAMRSLHLKNIKMPNNDEIISLKESVLSTHTLKKVLVKNIYCAPK